MEYFSKGAGAAALTTGIIGSVGALNSGLLGNIFGGTGCSDNTPVNRYELSMQRDLINKDVEIAYLRGRDAAKTDNIETYKYIDSQLNDIRHQLSEQAVYNGVNTATVTCIQSQIQQLYGLTKLVVPNTSVCPGWGNVTITPAAAPTTTG